MRFTLLAFFLLAFPVALNAQEIHEEEVQEPEAEDAIGQDKSLGEIIDPVEPSAKAADDAVAHKDMPAEVKPTTPPTGMGDTNFTMVLLQGLNKVTARAQPLEAPIGSVTRFGTIEIIAHKCWKSAPEDRPESAALLEVSELKQGEAPQRIFSGWMFASSPGLSSLEHPFYDITVLSCGKAANQ